MKGGSLTSPRTPWLGRKWRSAQMFNIGKLRLLCDVEGGKMKNLYPEIEDFYQNKYNEDGRMERRPLEYLRCKEIISRYLEHNKMEVADIGLVHFRFGLPYRITKLI